MISDALDGSFVGKLLKAVDVIAILKAAVIGFGVVAVLAAVQAAAAWLAAAAPFILLAVLIGLVVDELYNFIEGNETVLGNVIKWANAFDPNGHPVLEFFKSAIALLFNFTNPARWEQFIAMWRTLNVILGEITIKAFEYVGARIAELIGAGIQAVFDRFPLLAQLLGANASVLSGAANMLGFGGAFDAAGSTAADALGFGSGPKPSEVLAGQLGSLVTGLNPFSGGAAGPDAAGAITSTPAGASDSRSVRQTNNITINATQMNPEELASHIDTRLQSHHQEALASFSP
jgi:hypothetical protein